MAVADHPQTTQQEMIDVHNPVTQEVIGQVPRTSHEDVVAVVERARFAQKTWAKLTVKERLYFFRQWMDLLWERQQEGIDLIRLENGKSDSSAFTEFVGLDSIIQWYINHAESILKTEKRNAPLPILQRGVVYHKPYGVVGIIKPWNFPLIVPFMDIVPALIAGNTVVFKPSEYTPFTADWAVNLMYEVGIPRDVIQITHGDAITGNAIVDTVDYVQFTGSTEVGKIIAEGCVKRLIPYGLELGGNDPAVVLKGADAEAAAIDLIQGKFENAGQMCVGVERVYVEDSIHDDLVKQILRYMDDMTFGIEKDALMGSMTNIAEADRTQAHIEDAVAKGAKVVYGGKRRPDLGAAFHEPTILVDVDHTMTIMQEETFGPVMPIMRVRDAEEAIELANDSEYALFASVYSRDLKRAEDVASRIDSGSVSINRAPIFAFASPTLPGGGEKLSGIGRRNGPEGLLKYTYSQSMLIDNMLYKEYDVRVMTPLFKTVVNILRTVRRYVPFI